MSSFWGFWASMVLMTFGELTVIPTVSKYIADLAPADMRGRYMSFYWFAWGIARGAAPLIGGFLNDNINPRSIWIGGLVIGMISAIGLIYFLEHARRNLHNGCKYPSCKFPQINSAFQPVFQSNFYFRPFPIQNTEINRIPDRSIRKDHVVAEHSFLNCSQALNGTDRMFVARDRP